MNEDIQLIQKSVSRKILLNPGPATTSASVKSAMVVPDICPRESSFGALMHQICEGLLQLCGGEETHEVGLFVASGTGAMEAALVSAIAPDDCVLIVTNGAYGIRMRAIAERFSLPHDTVSSFGEYPDIENIASLLANGKFTHLAMIHHETSTGMNDPLEALAELCERMDVKLIVDMMSSFGAYFLDLSKVKIDYLFSSSNKCIHGMAGLSFVIFDKANLPALKDNQQGFYFDLYSQWQNLQQKNQLRFTPPVQICYAFLAAIEETLAEGVAKRQQRYARNWQVLYDGFAALGFHFFLPEEQQSKILLAIKLADHLPKGFDHFHDYLYEKGVTIYPGVIPESDTFRVAVIGDLYVEDMEHVMCHVKTYFSEVLVASS